MRLREDAGWYKPFTLIAKPAVSFKNCLSFWGINDKVWYGPRNDVLNIMKNMLRSWLYMCTKSTEITLLNLMRGNNYSLVDIPVSDARITHNGICWVRNYMCKKNTKLVKCIEQSHSTRHKVSTPCKKNYKTVTSL